MRGYVQSEQYHTIVENHVTIVESHVTIVESHVTIVESHVHLTWYQSHALKLSRANRLVNSQMSNKGLQKKKESSLD